MTYGYLMHHGVKGMRWGVRNYQNADGSLTAEGRARYGIDKKNANYGKANALGKSLHREMDYRNARAQLNRDVIRADLKAFKKGGGGIKTVLQNRKSGNEIIKQIDKGMEQKYGAKAAKATKATVKAKNIATLAMITAMSGVALGSAINKYASSGKSTTNNAIKSIDLGFVGKHFDMATVKNIWGPDAHDKSSYFKEMSKDNTIALMRPRKGYMV